MKRIIVTLLIATMVMALVGCAQSDVATTENKAEVKTEDSGASTETDASNAEKEKPVKLVWYSYNPTSPDDDIVFEHLNAYLREKINVEIEPHFLTGNDYKEKVSIMIASGNEVDICFTSSWAVNYMQHASKGAFVELDGLMEAHAPKLMDSIGEDIISAAKVDGKLYAIPTYKDIATQMVYFVRSDMVEKYDFDLSSVKSWLDIEPMLEVIKENEPGIVPMMYAQISMLESGLPFSSLSNNRSFPAGVTFADGESGEIQSLFGTEMFMDFAKGMKSWYDKGYLPEDVAALKDYTSELKAGKFFAFPMEYTPGSEVEMSSMYGYDLIPVAFTKPTLLPGGAYNSMQAITTTCEHPEKALEFLELLNTDPFVMNTVIYGIEGTHYEKIDDTYIKLLPEGVSASESPYYKTKMWSTGDITNTYLLEGDSADRWEQLRAFNDNAVPAPGLGFSFDVEPVKAEMAAVNNVYDEYLSVIRVGAVDPEIYLPEAMEKFEKVGGQVVIDELKRQYNEWLSSK